MTNPYSISPIGMNPLGTMGLDYSGAYSSTYMDPTMSGMMYGMPGMTGMGTMGNMGMMGMMGMYNPAFIQQYMSAQQQIEKQQVQHAADMHKVLSETNVANLTTHDKEIIEQISINGDVQRGVENLASAVRKGDSDSIISEYDKLKANILLKYPNQIKSVENSNTNLTADRIIQVLYAQTIQQQSGEVTSLRDDITKYGENAFTNGFNRIFLGNDGHNKKYSEEVLSYINGNARINDKGSKDRAQKWGEGTAHVAEGAGAAVTGAAAGVGLLAIGKAIPKLGSKFSFFKNMKAAGWIGAGALLLGDILWQMSRSDSTT